MGVPLSARPAALGAAAVAGTVDGLVRGDQAGLVKAEATQQVVWDELGVLWHQLIGAERPSSGYRILVNIDCRFRLTSPEHKQRS